MAEEKNVKTELHNSEEPNVLRADVNSETTVEAGVVQHLKKAKNGVTVLIPQPTDDPEDPMNWSWIKKHLVFFALLPGCFLTDWTLTYGTSLFVPQAMQCERSSMSRLNSCQLDI